MKLALPGMIMSAAIVVATRRVNFASSTLNLTSISFNDYANMKGSATFLNMVKMVPDFCRCAKASQPTGPDSLAYRPQSSNQSRVTAKEDGPLRGINRK